MDAQVLSYSSGICVSVGSIPNSHTIASWCITRCAEMDQNANLLDSRLRVIATITWTPAGYVFSPSQHS